MINTKNVVILNHDMPVLEALKMGLEMSGFTVAVCNLKDKSDKEILVFLKHHDPKLIIWDIPYPYQQCWDRFQKIKNELKDKKYIIMSTNQPVVEKIEQKHHCHQILKTINKPFNMTDLTDAVNLGVAVEHALDH